MGMDDGYKRAVGNHLRGVQGREQKGDTILHRVLVFR